MKVGAGMAVLMLAGWAAAAAPAGAAGQAGLAGQAQAVSLVLDGLRSDKGQILVCLTRSADHFPDCTKDPDRRHFTVAARRGPIALGVVPPGNYAIAIIHDENGNGKLDTFAGIPREGVGFSRNPVLRFGAPGFRSVQFPVAGAAVEQVVKLKYFL